MTMGRKRKITDCLPVVKFAGKRDPQVKGEVDQQQPGGGKAKKKSLRSEKKDASDAPPPKLSPLEQLVQFDLDWHFGPCTGITRMERWQRAQDLGLTPPQDVKQILMTHNADPQYQHNLWSTYAI
ncbi:DNA polymerase delta subunit 4 [Mantella aurantiaca]